MNIGIEPDSKFIRLNNTTFLGKCKHFHDFFETFHFDKYS